MIPFEIRDHPGHDGPVYITPFELFFNQKPDLRTLFPFGSVGYFKRERDSIHGTSIQRTNFQAQTFPGIAVGRSSKANGMLFWSPETQQFSVASEYTLDPNKQIRTLFPQLLNDGGFTLTVLSPSAQANTPHSLGDIILVQPEGPVTSTGEAPNIKGTIVSIPVPNVHPHYRVEWENGHCSDVPAEYIFDPAECEPHEVSEPEDPNLDPTQRDPFHPILPPWLRAGHKVGYNRNGQRLLGTLELTKRHTWAFTQHDETGRRVTEIELPDFLSQWRSLLSEGIMSLGHDMGGSP
ncbi:MAG: hypothetical protein ACRCT2_07600, partial [Plesiomonas shigelloides]